MNLSIGVLTNNGFSRFFGNGLGLVYVIESVWYVTESGINAFVTDNGFSGVLTSASDLGLWTLGRWAWLVH